MTGITFAVVYVYFFIQRIKHSITLTNLIYAYQFVYVCVTCSHALFTFTYKRNILISFFI